VVGRLGGRGYDIECGRGYVTWCRSWHGFSGVECEMDYESDDNLLA